MKSRYLFVLLAIATVIGIFSCVKEDDEPEVSNEISRLYISYGDYNANSNAVKYNNIGVLPFADDSANFAKGVVAALSDAKGGRTIYFHPSARYVFQSSRMATVADTFIYKLSVGLTGGLKSERSIPQGLLNNVRGLVFHPSLDKLYAVNVRSDSSRIYVLNLPRGLVNFAKPGQVYDFKTDNDYWDIAIVKSSVVVSKSGQNGGLEIYDNLIISRDSTIATADPSRVLTVANSSNIQGMSVDTVNNMLALTDFVQGGTDAAPTYEGRILIFDDYDAISKTNGTIQPTRIITGLKTKLLQPVDVELDFRKDSKYLYVADPESKAVYRFLKSDNGDVAPNATYQYTQGGRTLYPLGISLDARN